MKRAEEVVPRGWMEELHQAIFGRVDDDATYADVLHRVQWLAAQQNERNAAFLKAAAPSGEAQKVIAEAESLLSALPDGGEQWYVEKLSNGHEDEARVYGKGSWGVCKPTTPRPECRRTIAQFIAAAPRLIKSLIAFAASQGVSAPHGWNCTCEACRLLLSFLNGYSPSLLNTPKRNASGEAVLSIERSIAIARGDLDSLLKEREDMQEKLQGVSASAVAEKKDDEGMTLTDIRDMALNGLVGSAQVKEAMLKQIAAELDAKIAAPGIASPSAAPQSREKVIDALQQSTARLYADANYEKYLDEITGTAVDAVNDAEDDEHVSALVRQLTEAVSALRRSRDELRADLNRVALAAAEASPREEAKVVAADRLRAFVRAHQPGKCRMLSTPDCSCPLCDIDALAASQGVSAPAVAAWQPIDTAPERRKVLVSWVNELGKRRTALASYWPANTLDMADNVDEDHVTEEGRNVAAGWWEECEGNDDMFPLVEPLDFWQPLPAPPSGLAALRGDQH